MLQFRSAWNFHERVERNRGVVTVWINSSNWSKKTRAQFDRALDQLRNLSKQHWHKPNPASKVGDHTYVIRFRDVNSSQFRVFGHFFDDHHAFVMTFDGTEKDDVYYPKNYAAVAEQHCVYCSEKFAARTSKFEDRCAIC